MITTIAFLLVGQQTGAVEATARRRPTAANYRALAAAYESDGRYSEASDAFRIASEKYAKLGDPNAARVLIDLSRRYGTVAQLYVERPPDVVNDAKTFTQRRLEPIAGCFLGVNIEREDATRDPQAFNNLIGKRHAFYFYYNRYGSNFNFRLSENLRRAKGGMQIAWEPRRLSEVTDDAYLHGFARAIRESGIPVFIRFASEMNGPWTSYHGDPALYIEKFRLVSRVMHDEAPNAAMVWCPNEIPAAPIASYFPGDDAVDWVGVNFYSVLYNDADRARGAVWRNPVDSIDYIYRRYSARHPIMVGEWAASHRSIVDGQERPDFAIDKIGQFYSALPRRYPRVKAVHWLSMDTTKYAAGTRRLNDFSLFGNDEVARAYGDAIASSWFLDRAPGSIPSDAPVRVVPLTKGAKIPGDAVISAYVRSYEQRPQVVIKIGSRRFTPGTIPGAYEVRLRPGDVPPGRATVTLEVRDAAGRLAGRNSVPVEVQPAASG